MRGCLHTSRLTCGIVRRRGLELFEERQQLVVGLIAFGGAFDWVGLGQCLFLQRKIRIEVDLSGFDGLMAEPERNHGSVDATL